MPSGLPQGPGRPNRRPLGEKLEEDVPDEDLFDETVRVPSGPQHLRPRVFNPQGPQSVTRLRPLMGDVDAESVGHVSSEEPAKDGGQAGGEPDRNVEADASVRVSKLSSGAGFSVLLTPAEEEGKEEAPTRFTWFSNTFEEMDAGTGRISKISNISQGEDAGSGRISKMSNISQGEDAGNARISKMSNISQGEETARLSRTSNNSQGEAPPRRRQTSRSSQGSKGQDSNDENVSMMSGSEINVEEGRELYPDMSGGETETEVEEEDEEVVEEDVGPSEQEKRQHNFSMAVKNGVSSLQMLQKQRDLIWKGTFGYKASEKLFPTFLEAQDKAIEKAVSEWPLHPSRLYDVPERGEVKAMLGPRLLDSGELPEDVLSDEGRRGRLSKVTAGLLPIAGTWSSNGFQFFYVDMAAGPFCVFPEKAMVMELWRQDRLVHVGAALMSNDWKAGSGAFGRFVTGGVQVEEADKVAFPTCSHFHRNFQDFVDSCIG
eukprot:s1068_g4.t1